MDKRINVHLRDRIRFEKFVETENEFGEIELTWQEHLSCKAEVLPLSVSERMVSGQALSEAYYTIRIRSNPLARAIRGQMRAIYEEQILDISPAQKHAGRNQYLEFKATARSSAQ